MGICFDKDANIPFAMRKRLDATPLKTRETIIIFVIGGPGAGKSTLCKKLASKYKLTLIWISNLLRQEVERASEKGEYYKAFMNKGENVPSVLIVQLVVEQMLAHRGTLGYLVIGFPRDKKQV